VQFYCQIQYNIKSEVPFLKYILVCSLAWMSIVTKAQQIINIRHLTEDQGLSDKFIFAGVQDHSGFIWLATQRGLNRFDSHQTKVFNRRNSGMREDKVFQLVAKDNFLILLYGEDGLRNNSSGVADVFLIDSLTVKPLASFFRQMPFPESEIASIVKNNKEEILFFLKNNRLWKLDQSNKFIEHVCESGCDAFPFPSSIHHFYNDDIVAVSSSNDDRMLLIQEKLGALFDPKKDRFLIGYMDKKSWIFDLEKKPAKGLNISKRNNAWQEMPKLSIPDEVPFFFNNNQIQQTLVSFQNHGLFLLQENGLEVLADVSKLSLHPYQINSFFVDAQENYWICTTAGAYVITRKKNPFSTYFTAESRNRQPTIIDQTRGIYKSKEHNSLVAAIWNEIGVYDFSNSSYTYFDPSITNIIYDVKAIGNKIYYVKNGLKTFDFKNKPTTILPYPDNAIWTIFPLSDTAILLGTNNRIDHFNIKAKEIRNISARIPLEGPIKLVYKIMGTKNGEIWAAAESGLYRLDQGGDIIEFYGSEKIGYTNFFDLHIDSEGIFWLASRYNGLIKWDRQLQTATSIAELEGMPTNTAYCILPDDNNRLWISTDKGLVKFNKATQSIKIYSMRDGLPFDEFNRISAHKSYDRQLYFGGINGIIGFDPNTIPEPSKDQLLNVLLTGIEKFNANTGHWEDIYIQIKDQRELIIRPGERLYNINFSMVDYQTGPVKYSYKLEGLDKGWNLLNDNSFRLTGLPYGKYTLYIKGVNSDGIPTNEVRLLDITVLTPFYLKIQFIIALILLLGLMISGLIGWRLKRIKDENTALEELVRERTVDLAEALDQKELLLQEIHHRVKNNLAVMDSMITLQLDNTENQEVVIALEENQHRLRGISLIHQSFSYELGIGKIDLLQFLEELLNHFNEALQPTGVVIESKINITNSIFKSAQAVPLGLMINELITNSTKHARVKDQTLLISIHLSEQEGRDFYFEYRDNGPGIKRPSQLRKDSLGMDLIYLFCKQIGGKLQYQNDGGSKFFFYFKSIQ